MHNLRLPTIAFNSLTNLRPELIGLAAWLGASNIYPGDRNTILKYVAEHGTIGPGTPGFDRPEDRFPAQRAHEDWANFLCQLDEPATKPVVFHRNGNGIVPPIRGGAPVTSSFVGHPADEELDNGEDIAF